METNHTNLAARALPDRRPFMLAAATAVVGIAISLYAGARMAAREEASALERFRLEAETLRVNTERELAVFKEVLESIRALHGLSGEIAPEALDEFVEKGMIHQRSVLGAFGFAQRISPALRAALEEGYARDPRLGYRMVQRGPAGDWVTAGTAAAYFPLTWQSGEGVLGVPIGYDFSSESAAHYAIERMQRVGRTVLVTAPVTSDEGAARRHWVFAPIVYRQPDAAPGTVPDVVVGFAVGLLDPRAILERVAALSVPSPGLRLDLTPAAPDWADAEEIQREAGEWRYRHPLTVIDTRWTFSCYLPVTITGRRSVAVVVAGLLITMLMTSQLLLLAGRTRRIEAEVKTRTEDLRRAKAQLEEQMQERIRLEEEMSELAARERRRLGRDLHDSLGQKLTGAVYLSRSLLRHLEAAGDEQATHARTLNDTLKSAVGQVRDMARGLSPVALSDEHLGSALEQLVEEMTGLYGVSCEIAEHADTTELNDKVKEQLYLIAREAVNNAARHAQARRVTVALRANPDGCTLCIEDDGQGFDPDREGAGGMGLRIMRHRAGLIDADFVLRTSLGQGTCIRVIRPAARTI